MSETPVPNRTPHWAWRIVRTGLVIYLLLLLLMMLFETSLVFHPAAYPLGDWNPPGLEFQDAKFTAADGTKLHGWYMPHPQPRAVILFCHGNAGNITHRADMLRHFHSLGATVLIFDYRGYGRSEGSPDEAGILQDARAARRWLAERAGLQENQIVLFGESLGTGVAVDLAANDGARGLILQSAFSSLPDVAAHHYPWVPVRWLMRNRLNSATQIPTYRESLLQIHGERDRIIPIGVGRQLFDAANEPKQFVVLPGGDHNDLPSRQMLDTIDSYLSTLP